MLSDDPACLRLNDNEPPPPIELVCTDANCIARKMESEGKPKMINEAQNHALTSKPVFSEYRATHSKRAWERCESLFDLRPLHTTQCKGVYVNQSWHSGCFRFDQRIMDGNSHVHDRKHIRETGDMLFIYRYLEGHGMGRSGEEPFSMRPGQVSLRDASRHFEAVQTPAIYQLIYFDRESVGYDPSMGPPLLQFSSRSPMGCLFDAEFDYFFSQLMGNVGSIEMRRLDQLRSCLHFALLGERSPTDVRTVARDALGNVIRLHIESRLKCPTLSATTLLREFGLSRATLYRIFEDDGGVRRYINDRRLYRAVSQISQSPMVRGAISQAAADWGFSSGANFNRAVRNAFGVAPNSLFGRQGAAVPAQLRSNSASRRQAMDVLRSGQRDVQFKVA